MQAHEDGDAPYPRSSASTPKPECQPIGTGARHDPPRDPQPRPGSYLVTRPGEDRRARPLVPELDATLDITAEAQRRAARLIVGHATDPDDARELLAMLGLLHTAQHEPSNSCEP